jgi:hypothetical protein
MASLTYPFNMNEMHNYNNFLSGVSVIPFDQALVILPEDILTKAIKQIHINYILSGYILRFYSVQ